VLPTGTLSHGSAVILNLPAMLQSFFWNVSRPTEYERVPASYLSFFFLASGNRKNPMQFGTSGTLERHGFARNRIWIIDDEPPPTKPNGSGSKASVNLLLKPSEDDLKCWPHWYAFLMACLGFSLSYDCTILHVSNK
jgi:hypothetical protein